MRHALRLAQDPRGSLVDENKLFLGEHDQVVASVLVKVAHDQGTRLLHQVAAGDLLRIAEASLAVVEENRHLGRVP